MMRLEVTAVKSEPPGRPIAAEFDEMGGSIGRADGNTLVLPDAQRYISRTQASIRFHGGAYRLRDAGSATPTYVNQTAVGNGNEVALNDGDELRIGEYTLSVSVGRAAGGMAQFPPAGASPFQDPPQRDDAPRARAVPNPADAGARERIDDPFAPAAPHAGAARVPDPNVIPSDFDPFSDLAAASAPGKRLIPDDLGLGPSASEGVDDLFGLKQPSAWDPLGPQDSLSDLSNSRAHGLGDDLLGGGAAGGAPRRDVPAQHDHTPALSGAFRPPQVKRDQPPRDANPPLPEPTLSGEQGEGAIPMVLSWESGPVAGAPDDIKSVIVPAPKPADALREHSPRERSAAPPAPAVKSPPPAVSPADTAPRTHPDNEALLRAFLAGAGTTELRLPDGLTPELMNLLGRLLRESIGGTLQLLLARALTKREVRAEATMIVARENNPLKFSPTVEAALMHLLVPHGRGFMPPVGAVKDAYNDLRSHQFGIMAGMRGALTSVLARFNPAQLEQRLTRKRTLASSLLTSRKAKLWELYEELYIDISREAEDDFQTLFGREFLKAYEAQIQKLEQDDPDPQS